MNAFTDEELVAKYKEAGRDAGAAYANELFQRHYARVALWCFRVAGDREAATDLAQDVFVKAWAHLDHFRQDSKFSTWLYMIARNHCFNASKRDSRNLEDAVDYSEAEHLAPVVAGFDKAIEKAQLADIARKMVASELTPVEARVMTLHFVEDVSLPAVSRLLGLDNASGAKAYVVSARRKLKAALQRWTEQSRTVARRESKGAGSNERS